MDVQGSQYHLINGAGDWARCVDSATGELLGPLWAQAEEGIPSAVHTALEYDPTLDVLRLRRDTPLFRRAGRTLLLDEDARRGAGRDGYGNWFWIDTDAVTVRWRPAGANASAHWWAAPDSETSCAENSGPGFARCAPPVGADVRLQGLAVTTRHYLLVGYLGADAPSEEARNGLLVFDLQAGGEPLQMPWPAGTAFVPWDITDTADGGALVLDKANAAYWRLDPYLRLRARQVDLPALFQPAEAAPPGAPVAPEVINQPVQPIPTPLNDSSLRSPVHAVSIEPGPDDGVLILDSDPLRRGYSLVHLFTGDQLVWTVSLANAVEVIDPADPTDTPQRYSLLGYDFAYTTGPAAPDSADPAGRLLYIADAEGKQVIAFQLHIPAPGSGSDAGPEEPVTVTALPDYLPLRRWDGKALVRAGSDLYYDFSDRWIPVEVYTECRFEPQATLTTSIAFTDPLAADPSGTRTVATPAGSSFDSQLPGCIWHRLLIDAQKPNGTIVTIRARANDDPLLLSASTWLPQPVPYLRSGGPELPWYDPWADRRDTGGDVPDGTGTWELLFQQVIGRYIEIEVTLFGNGRSTPLLRSLRVWYPRFSYPEHYLPAIYPASDSPDRFLDRFLANFEGIYTALEERIEHTHLILDARTAPAPDLPWLACWFGLALDPEWSEAQRRFLIRHIDEFYRCRGTVPGVLSMLRLYLGSCLDESIFSCGDDAGGVRIVERFLTRDLTETFGTALIPSLDDVNGLATVAAAAHRFDVLVPAALSSDALGMVARIVEAAKPAHTWFDVRPYYDLFVVGQARLGLDTELGDSPAFTPVLTGGSTMAAGYLGFPRPFDLTDRLVSDRDRVGDMPAL